MTATDTNGKLIIPIMSTGDITRARQQGRALANTLGLRLSRGILAATVITELAKNILDHGQGGEVTLAAFVDGERIGLGITARDEGPGITNIEQVMRTGLSSNAGKNYGLPELRSLADVFRIESTPGHGTTVLVVLFSG